MAPLGNAFLCGDLAVNVVFVVPLLMKHSEGKEPRDTLPGVTSGAMVELLYLLVCVAVVLALAALRSV